MTIDVYKEWLGIPESVPRPPDHYQLLRLAQFEDDEEKIRAHYKKLNGHVRKYATGQYSNQSQDLLNELAKAMLCLTDADRKRDYDESLGREFDAETDALGRQPILEKLIADGHLSREQKREVEAFASARGLTERDAVVQMKLVEPPVAARALAGQLGYSYGDLEGMLPEDAALDLVPRSLVKKHTFIPLFVDDDQILVGCVDQPEHELEEELRLRFGVPVRPVIATPRAVNQAIAQYYAPGMRDEAAVQEAAKQKSKAEKKAASPNSKTKKRSASANRPSFDDLNEEEQGKRKQIGIIILCASVIVPLLPKMAEFQFVKWRMILLEHGWLSWLPLIVLPFSVGLAANFVLRSYWK